MRHWGSWLRVRLVMVVIAFSVAAMLGCQDEERPYATLRFKVNHHCIVASPDNFGLAIGLWDDTVLTFAARSRWAVYKLDPAHPNVHHSNGWTGAHSVCFSPDGRFVAAGSWLVRESTREALDLPPRPAIRVWRADHKAGLMLEIEDDRNVDVIAWSPDGKTIASGHWGGGVKLWDARTGEPVAAYGGDDPNVGRPREVTALRFSPDSKQVVWGTHDGDINVRDIKTGQAECLAGKGAVSALAFSPRGDRLAAVRRGAVWLWTTNPTKHEYTSLAGMLTSGGRDVYHQLPVIAFTSDGKQLVTWGYVTTESYGDDGVLVPESEAEAESLPESDDVVSAVWQLDGTFDFTVRHHRRTHTGGSKQLAIGRERGGRLVLWEAESTEVPLSPFISEKGAERRDYKVVGRVRTYDALTGESKQLAIGRERGGRLVLWGAERGNYKVVGRVRAYDALTGERLSRD